VVVVHDKLFYISDRERVVIFKYLTVLRLRDAVRRCVFCIENLKGLIIVGKDDDG